MDTFKRSVIRLTDQPWFWLAASVILMLGRISPAVALGAGIVLGLTVGAPKSIDASGNSKRMLQAAVVLMGFGMQLVVVARVGASSAGLTLVSIVGTLGLAFLLGKLLQVDRELTTLVGSGTAICGGSAIAAMAPSIGASAANTGVAMAVVFVLNGVALVLFPPIGHALGMSQAQFGLWAALAIHDTSSVVGAAAAYGRQALELATAIKLTRALWILPLAFIAARMTASGKSGAKFPWFLLGFLGAALAAWVIPAPAVFSALADLGRALMTPTLFLLGATLTPDALKRAGARPLMLGVALWLIVSSVTAMLVLTNTWSVSL